jgi:hypothetical protein
MWKLDGDRCKFETFSTFTITFATIITTYTWRSTSYWTIDGENGNTTCFWRVQTNKTIGPPIRLKTAEGFPFEFELGRKMVYELGSFAKGSQNPMT